HFAGYTFAYRRLEQFVAPDKDVNLAVLDLYRGRAKVATLHPQLNFHRNWDQPQSEIAIRTRPSADIYVVLAAIDPDRSGVFRIHYNPLVVWIWFGALVAVTGGLVALLAGRRRATPAPPASPPDIANAQEPER